MKQSQLFLALLVLTLTACGGTSEGDTEADREMAALVNHGHAIVSAECLICHGLMQSSPGPRADAPALSTVLETYASDALFDDFRAGIHLGHEDMPTFDLTVMEADAVLAFLQNIRAPLKHNHEAP